MADDKNQVDENLEMQTNADENGGEPETITLTQAELDEKIKAAKAQVKKKLPPKGEYDEFLAWKKEQQKDEPQNAEALEMQRKYEETQRELERYKNREKVAAKGVNIKFLDFVTFEASKLVDDETDFDAALDAYLKANAQFTKPDEQPPAATGMRHGSTPTKMDGVEKAFYDKNPNLKTRERE